MVVAATGLALTFGMSPALGAPGADNGPGPNDSGKHGATADAPVSIDALAVEPYAEIAVDGLVTTYTSPTHTFTLDDIIGNTLGQTDADNPNVIKDGDAGETLTGETLTAKDGSVLYPINSVFGFDVQDFVGATEKLFDTNAEEGWAGEFTDANGSGLQFSDADTASLKSGNLIGTWAAGLGGNEIKASTEHFTVMEAVLSCFQTVPYDYWASEDDYLAGLPSVPAVNATVDTVCVDNALPNPVTTTAIKTAIDMLVPNEDSVIPSPTDLYLGTNYSVTLKDDGKVLYRWGQAVKRPTDIRFATSIPLPDEWKTPEALSANDGKGLLVTKAELVLRHAVTNNPNDQIRPEDWENEGATGLLPDYVEDSSGRWYSTQACYEGDGDFIPENTLLRDPAVTYPGALSSDLLGGFSNAWYTTIDRDPFEWAYKAADGSLVGSPIPDANLGELVSGPRWRMLSNKFGQDIPSLEIPTITCDLPPYEKGTIKYEVGELATTTINLLDWSKDPEDARWVDGDVVIAQSPFAYSAGWLTTWSSTTAADFVPGQMILDEDSDRCASTNADGDCVTALGTTLTDDFDVSFYVKGDKKPLKVYDVMIRLEYEGGTPAEPVDFGDAPATYGTAGVYRTVGDTYLGAEMPDAETEPQAPLDGTGDDVTGINDEDGVSLPAEFLAGQTAVVPIVANGGELDAYVDWNIDGDFADDGEMIAEGLAAPTSLSVTAPVDVIGGTTCARFVLTGDDNVGEVEDYAVDVTAAEPGYDFGDAQQSYGTASHQISTLSLNTVDAEDISQYSPDALGDDSTGVDDEDGVNLSSFVVGKTSNVRVTATEAGYLAAWVDWNADGKFDAVEQVADQSVKAGTSVVKVDVPVDAYKGTVIARFRLSPTAGTAATGEVIGGEVEDHAVTIAGKPGGGPGKPDSTADAADAATLPPTDDEQPLPALDEPALPPTDDEAILPPAEDDGTLPTTDDEPTQAPVREEEATLPPTEEEPAE
jgi:hypothetical protein